MVLHQQICGKIGRLSYETQAMAIGQLTAEIRNCKSLLPFSTGVTIGAKRIDVVPTAVSALRFPVT